MLQKQYRLKSRPAFKKALTGRTFYTSRYFAMYALPHSPGYVGTPPKFGLIVSKKIDKRAVGRNRVKRRLREAIRQTLLTISSDSEPQRVHLQEQLGRIRVIVLIARAGMTHDRDNRPREVPFEELCRQLRRGFEGRPQASR